MSIVVSLVPRLRVATRLTRRTSASAPRKASFSAGVPTVTRRQSVSRGHPEQSRTSTLRSRSACQTCRPVRCRGRNSTKLAPLGTTSISIAAIASLMRSRSATISFTRSSMSSTKRNASRPAICLAASRWYGSTTLSSSATSHAGPTRYPRREAAMLHVFENVRTTTSAPVVGDQRQRRPVGELGVRLVDHDEAGRDRQQLVHPLRRFDQTRRVVG